MRLIVSRRFAAVVFVCFVLFLAAHTVRAATRAPRGAPSTLSTPARAYTLAAAHLKNQQTRAKVTSWIERSDWDAALFHYGLPAGVFHLVNLDVGPSPINHDLVSFLGAALHAVQPRKLHYLEIGVSVGKCIYTQLQFFGRDAVVVAFDVEDINPTFEKLLSPRETSVLDTWTEERLVPGVTTTRRAAGAERRDSMKSFVSPAGGELRYLASDEFNLEGWRHLAQQKLVFDLVYSDALHTPEALLFEAQQLAELGLINVAEHFAIVWDDCEGDMVTRAVCPILAQLRERAAHEVYFDIFLIGGWLGKHEILHNTCVATTLQLDKLRQQDALLGALNRVALC